jgi:hypothetical protein
LLCKDTLLVSLMEVLLLLWMRKSNEKFAHVGIMKIGQMQKKRAEKITILLNTNNSDV